MILQCFTETKFKHAVYPRLVYPSDSIESLYNFSTSDDKLVLGACTPLSVIQHASEAAAADSKFTRTAMPIHDMLRWFASTQIRNVASLGGNLVTASPISDMNPLLAGMGATLVISKIENDGSSVSRRTVPVSEFFLKYRTVNIEPSEIVECIEVPLLGKVFDYVKPFKQARRREDDISIVTSGMRIRLAPQGDKFVIEHIAMAFGGMAPKTIMAVETAKMMIGAEFNQETFSKAQESLMKEMNLPESVPGGQAAFRMTLTASFLQKFYITAVEELKKDIETINADPSAFPAFGSLPAIPSLGEDEISGATNFLSGEKPSFSGVQKYPAPKVAKGLEEKILPNVDGVKQASAAEAVGKASVHQSGSLHCTGEAIYADDIPSPPGLLHACLITSNECGSIFESLDAEPALRVPGVVSVVAAEDITALGGKNVLGPIAKDENVFLPRGEKVRMVGQVLGVVVAETLESAELGARAAGVKYQQTGEKPIMTIEDAIAANSFYESTHHCLTRGDEAFFEKLKEIQDTSGDVKVGDTVKVSGVFHSGAQEHFYLEPNSTIVIPSESDTNLTIYCSTQAPTKTQNFCASSTGELRFVAVPEMLLEISPFSPVFERNARGESGCESQAIRGWFWRKGDSKCFRLVRGSGCRKAH